MTLKNDAKFEEKLTLSYKNDMWNLVNFKASSGKSENLHFVVLLLLYYEYIMILCLCQKSAEELCVKFEEELTCALKNDMGNLVNFTGTLKNLKILKILTFLSKRYNV